MRKYGICVAAFLLLCSVASAQLCGTNGPPNEYTVCRSTPEWGGLPDGLPVVDQDEGQQFLPDWYFDDSIVGKDEIGLCAGISDPNCLGRVESLGWTYFQLFTPTEPWCEQPPGWSGEWNCWTDPFATSGYIQNGSWRYNGEFSFPPPNSGETKTLRMAGWIDFSDSQSGMYDYIVSLRPTVAYTYLLTTDDPIFGPRQNLESERLYYTDPRISGSFQWLAVERFYANSGTPGQPDYYDNWPFGRHERWYFEASIVVPDYIEPPACTDPTCISTEFLEIVDFGMRWNGQYRHKWHRASGKITWSMRAYVEEDQPVDPCADVCDDLGNSFIATVPERGRSDIRYFEADLDRMWFGCLCPAQAEAPLRKNKFSDTAEPSLVNP